MITVLLAIFWIVCFFIFLQSALCKSLAGCVMSVMKAILIILGVCSIIGLFRPDIRDKNPETSAKTTVDLN